MIFQTGRGVDDNAFVTLFEQVFTASEGTEEGRLLGDLVRAILDTTSQDDLHVFCALDGRELVGAVCFSRLLYSEDLRTVFLLSPMAVHADRQGEGIGQALIHHALEALRSAGVDVVLTYGDPAFYRRVGFSPITEAIAAAPYDLSMPQGWLGQSLSSAALEPLKGEAHCVAAFARPEIW
ncbi:hypothetical protein TP2_10235 [Thioclava pacifica DSM 10166]|uniref:N-acetyltransferase domain-containing protein n=1 Tax=Thioclava pacifica DSM 10166 TaxID=1353537 RepID=A0A074JR45_9RHOB|nr:hypothetical protein TP2_10235 [Thioclava pacifica DSM 10166]